MHHSKPCVLVVEDEIQTRKMIEVTLASCQFKVVTAESGNEALRLAASYKPDAIILDLGLPDLDGTEVLKRLRTWTKIPVIVLSARSDSEDIVHAFELGADDYVTKPFNMEVLIARIQVALRHGYQKEVGESTLQAGDITIDLIRHEVTVKGRIVEFSPKEYELLRYLICHHGKMLTHRQILKEIWGDTHTHDKQYLRVYIMQLRQKIEPSPKNPRYIIAKPGIGYRFDIPSPPKTPPQEMNETAQDPTTFSSELTPL